MTDNFTTVAQYAVHSGPNAADRPAFDSSPNGLAFQVGLWAREHNVTVHEVRAGRGYIYTLNGLYRINLKGDSPTATRI